MKDYYRLELDKYEIGILINAINEFRNSLLNKEQSENNNDIIFAHESIASPVNDLLLKVIDLSEKKPLRKVFER